MGSKLDELEFEEDHHLEFELVQSSTVFDQPERTLEEEGLFPRAMIQIRDLEAEAD